MIKGLDVDLLEYLNRYDLYKNAKVETKINGSKSKVNNLNDTRKITTAFNRQIRKSSKIMIEIPVYDIRVVKNEEYNEYGEKIISNKYEGYYRMQPIVENHFIRQSGLYATTEKVQFRYFSKTENKEISLSKNIIKGFSSYLMFRQCLEDPGSNSKNKSFNKEFKKCRNAIFNGVEGYFALDENGNKTFIEISKNTPVPKGIKKHRYEYFCSSQSQVLNVKGAWIDVEYKVPEHILESVKKQSMKSKYNKDKYYYIFLSELRGAKAAIEISTYGAFSRELSNIYDNWYAMYRLRKIKKLKIVNMS